MVSALGSVELQFGLSREGVGQGGFQWGARCRLLTT